LALPAAGPAVVDESLVLIAWLHGILRPSFSRTGLHDVDAAMAAIVIVGVTVSTGTGDKDGERRALVVHVGHVQRRFACHRVVETQSTLRPAAPSGKQFIHQSKLSAEVAL
jgi:hypothetical protein